MTGARFAPGDRVVIDAGDAGTATGVVTDAWHRRSVIRLDTGH